jgi:acetyl esterase/lipase
MRWIAFLCVAGLTGCKPVTPMVNPPVQAQSSIKWFLDLPYGDTPLQKLDLFAPKDAKGEPLLIFIHGGAWIGGDKETYGALGRRFANEGLAVALLNYRLSKDPAIKNPVHVQDTAKAYVWLASHAGQYGFDPRKIYVSGHSAGAHNAGMMATGTFLQDAGVPKEHLLAGFIGLEGIYDVGALNKRFPTYRNWFLSKAFGDESKWAAGSPTLRAVTLKTPWLIIQSTEDKLVDVPQAENFAKHLKEAGVPVQLEISANGDHDEVMTRLMVGSGDASDAFMKFVKR